MSETANQLEEIRAHLKRHDQRFDAIDQRFEAVEGGVRAVGVQIENLQSTVQLLAEQMSGFIRTSSDVRTRVECLEEKQTEPDIRLRILERQANP